MSSGPLDFENSKAAEVLRASGYGDDFIYTWFFEPNDFLEGDSPYEALGNNPEGVAHAASML